MTEQAPEDTTDYKQMAAYFQHRLGELQMAHEHDVYLLRRENAVLQAQLQEAQQAAQPAEK